MNVCILMGSPRVNGNTETLLKPFMAELERLNVKVDYIPLKGNQFLQGGGRFMITGNIGNLENEINLSLLGISFSSKPIIHGGTAMEYYGLRKRGQDIDFIISNEDYQALAKKHPNNKKDIWGDLGLLVGEYELFRSVYRFDYDFYSEGAVEYDKFKVISFERLFFLKTLSFKQQPEVLKLTNDFELMVKYYNDTFRNREYVENAMKHIKKYESVPNGTIFNDNY